ncbi:MAG: polyprenyl synthetase family protein, partial [Chloroflexales bacterium]|nr:polyprenyl synthetase family protein [Chloroflexales bacterium]
CNADGSAASYDAGKLLRPQLALLACQAVGGAFAQALPLAAGIQLIHDFSLIHDDIEDNSDTRRGRTTVWKQWGLAQGINAGDGMFVVAHLSLHRLADAGVPPAVALEVLRRFDQTILTICEGQFLDLSYEGRLDIGEGDYLAMISRKTAALIAAAAGLGAIVGGASLESAKALFDFGQCLGLAFQIQDDVLGIWGDPEVTGKPRAADLYQRKLSLPVVHALRHADRRDELARVYRQEAVGDADVGLALAILEQAGSRGYTAGVAETYHHEALAALDRVQPAGAEGARARDTIREITAGLLDREA